MPGPQNAEKLQEMLVTIELIHGKKYSLALMLMMNQHTGVLAILEAAPRTEEQINRLALLTEHTFVANMTIVVGLIMPPDYDTDRFPAFYKEFSKNIQSLLTIAYPDERGATK